MDINKLRLRQAENKVSKIRALRGELQGVESWISYMRKALNMSVKALAAKLNQSPASVYQAERMEKEGAVTLKQLKKMADAMNCELVYAFLPRTSLKEAIEDQAYTKAKKYILESHLHMELEEQQLDKESLKAQIQDLADEIKNQKDLWDEE